MHNPFAAVRAPAARDLWLAGLGVNIVRWLEILVFGLLALELTGSPFWVAVMTFARMLPLLSAAVLTSLVGGWSKRRVLLVALATLTGTGVTLLLIALFATIALWHLLVAAFVAGFAWTIEVPVRRMALAEAAGIERVQASMGLEVVANQLTRIIGPALGGLLLQATGSIGIFVLGVTLHGVSFWLVWRQAEPVLPTTAGVRPSLARSLAEGISYVRRHRLLTGTLMVTLVFNLWGFPHVSLVPVMGETVLGLSPAGIGLLAAADALGALICAFILIERAGPLGYAQIYSLGALGYLVCTFAFGFTTTWVLAGLALFVAGFGLAGFNAMQISLPIAASPQAMRVRVMGIVTVAIGAGPIGFLHAGLMAEWLGPALAQKVIAGEGILALILVFRLWPELLRREAPQTH
jgi:MFS family permease